MPIVNYTTLPEIHMRAGITGKWIAGLEHGSVATSVLANTAAPGAAVPRHFHEYEEIVLVEAGQLWVELDDTRLFATSGQVVIIPPRTPHCWGVEGADPARVMFIWPVAEPFAPGKSTYLDGSPPAVS